jgi:hypothetical protein
MNLIANPTFYVGYPAVGLGVHSIPLAVVWALPWSVVGLVAATIVGWRIGPQLVAASRPIGTRYLVHGLTAIAAIVVLANVVVILAVLPQQGSPRVFAPTWLVLAIGGAWAGAYTNWRRPHALGVCTAIFAAGAVLSLALSASVRLRSADFTARATRLIAARIPNDGRVAICEVPRTVVEPAPRGATRYTTSWRTGLQIAHCSTTRAVMRRFTWQAICGISRALPRRTSMPSFTSVN